MDVIKKLITLHEEGVLEDFSSLCEKITRSSDPEYFGPNRELALGLVRRTGNLCEAGELDYEELEKAALFAAELSGIPTDLLLIEWVCQASYRISLQRIAASEKDGNAP